MFPKRVDPLWVVVAVTIYYSIIFVSGMVGNLLACLVIARNKHMHTITNYYLFSMSVSDMLLLVSGLPHEVYFMWNSYPYIFGEVGCFLSYYLLETSYNATALTITAFTVERYLAICHPFLSHSVSTLSRALTSIACIWLIALLSALPQPLQVGIVDGNLTMMNMTQDEEFSFCTIRQDSLESSLCYSLVFSSVMFFMLPLGLITVLYMLIGLRLYSTSHQVILVGQCEAEVYQKGPEMKINSGHHHSASTKRVINMLVAVVVAFFICWAPFQAQRLLAVFEHPDIRDEPSRVMWYISGLLYFSSTTVNPILYNMMSRKFREAFKRTLTTCRGEINSNVNWPGLKWNKTLKYKSRDSKLDSAKTMINMDQTPVMTSFKKSTKKDSDNSSKTTASTNLSTDICH